MNQQLPQFIHSVVNRLQLVQGIAAIAIELKQKTALSKLLSAVFCV